MKAKELAAIAKVMRAHGISHYKTDDCTLVIDLSPLSKKPRRKKDQDLASVVSDPIEHKTEELTRLMGLNDVDLVNRLFPEEEATA